MKSYSFLYEVETFLWKYPFDKTISDELEYSKFRHQNTYHDINKFAYADPLKAREKAINYLRNMIDVLCESLDKTFKGYWQAVKDLQPLFRAEHPLAHRKFCNIQFDDDLLCGVSLTMNVEYKNLSDRLTIFNLGRYDDSHKEDTLYDVIHFIVELERERKYYKLAKIPVSTETIDLTDIGMAETEVMPSIMDWREFSETFAETNIDLVFDTEAFITRQREPLI